MPDYKNHSFAKDGFNYRTAYFEDVDGQYYKLTLSVGKNGEIKKLRQKLMEHNLLYTDFTETMTGDTYQEQLEKTLATSNEEMEYYCLVTFGEKEVLDPLTKKFSLYH